MVVVKWILYDTPIILDDHVNAISMKTTYRSNQVKSTFKTFTNNFTLVLILNLVVQYLSVLKLNIIIIYFKFVGGRNISSNQVQITLLILSLPSSQNTAPNPHPQSIKIHTPLSGSYSQ